MFKPKLYLPSNAKNTKADNSFKTDIKNKAISLLDWFGINLQTGDTSKFLNQKGEWETVDGVNLYNSNGTIQANRTVDLDDKYLLIGDGIELSFAIGDLTSFNLSPDNIRFFADYIEFGAKDEILFASGNLTLYGNDSLIVGCVYDPNDFTNNLLLTFSDSTLREVEISDGDTGYSIMKWFGLTGQVEMEETANFNFADDTAAAAGGIELNCVYHNNGALRIRLT